MVKRAVGMVGFVAALLIAAPAPQSDSLPQPLDSAAVFDTTAAEDSATASSTIIPSPTAVPLPNGVELRLELSPAEVSIGDRMEVVVALTYPAGWSAEMPHGIAQLGDFEVLGFHSSNPKRKKGGMLERRWSYSLALFGTGDFLLRPLVVMLTDSSSGVLLPLATNPALLSVVSRGLDSNADIAADAPPIAPRATVPLWGWIAAAVVLIGGGVALLLWKRKRRKNEPAHLRALREIEQLLARGDGSSDNQQRHNLFCLRLGLTMRGYLDSRYGMETREKTTAELLQTLAQQSGPLLEWRESIEQFSRRTDQVKFAGSRLESGEAEALASFVRQLVQKTQPSEQELLNQEKRR